MFNVKNLTKKILVALRNFRFRNVATISKSSEVTWCGKIVNTYNDKTAVNIGANSIIEGELLVFPPTGRISIGDWCYLGNLSRVWAKENVTIGNRVLISHNVNIFDNQTHPINPTQRHDHFKTIMQLGHISNNNIISDQIIIEDDVWIGANTTLLMGIKIGKGAIIGANSLVLKNVKPFTFVAGNPAIKKKNIQDKGLL